MMLKKQTVWLLTMLSLLIVLSVYYMTSPGGDQVALVDVDDEKDKDQEGMDDSGDIETDISDANGSVETDAEGNPISATSSDELFTQLRLELTDKRSREKEQYEEVVANSSASIDEKNEAMEAMQQLEELDYKEGILEKMIQSDGKYTDVFVRAEEEVVHVRVKADVETEESIKTESLNIMQMVRDEFGDIEVQVKFQPTE